jgi:hypothetical protein
MFKETDKRFRKTDKQLQETKKMVQATTEQLQETKKMVQATTEQVQATTEQVNKNDSIIKKVEASVGRLGNRIGDVIEQLTTPYLHKKFRTLGYQFDRMSRNLIFDEPNGEPMLEVDVFVENGLYALAVEVKTKLGADDLKEHQLRMETLRRYADTHNDPRKFLGAVAAPTVDISVRKAAHRMGFFVIEPSEDSVNVIVPDGFKPREW